MNKLLLITLFAVGTVNVVNADDFSQMTANFKREREQVFGIKPSFNLLAWIKAHAKLSRIHMKLGKKMKNQ